MINHSESHPDEQQNTNAAITETQKSVIEECYTLYRSKVRAFIFYKLGDADLAEDLTQDAFVRLMESGQTIRRETMRNMLYTTVNHIIIDWLRRYYVRQDADEEILYSSAISSTRDESQISADDIAHQEQLRINQMPIQRRKVYVMSRFEEKNPQEIADELSLSRRTVENHLLLGRKEVREYIRQII